jgi:hypothetical protein
MFSHNTIGAQWSLGVSLSPSPRSRESDSSVHMLDWSTPMQCCIVLVAFSRNL